LIPAESRPGGFESAGQATIERLDQTAMSLNYKRLIQFVLLFSAALTASSAFATTYYVDYSSGNDSNGGTSKSSPWQHAPGMGGCTANCANANPGPGDSIILKGGVTWPNSAFGWIFRWSGSSGNTLYIGVDHSWFAGSSWNRPVFNGGGASVAGSNDSLLDFSTFNSPSPSYLVVDNIEFTGLYWPANSGGSYIRVGNGQNIEIKNMYFHGWSHAAGVDYGWAITGDAHIPNVNSGSSFHDSICDGSDTDEHSMGCVYGSPPVIYNNVMRQMSNGMIVNGAQSVHDNLVEYINQSVGTEHENGFEDNGSEGLDFYNNVIRHTSTSNGLTLWFAPVKGYAVNIWNNVVYDTTDGNVVDFAPSVQGVNGGCPGGTSGDYCATSGTFNLYNNTIECGPDGNPTDPCGVAYSGADGFNLRNNHFITSFSDAIQNCTSSNNCSMAGNLIQTQSVANNLGYSSGETYAFSPVTAAVGAGTDLTAQIGSLVNGLSSLGLTAPSASLDTSYACNSNSTTKTVSCPVRTSVTRAAGSWNVGAYQFGSASASQPQPPTGLAASVN